MNSRRSKQRIQSEINITPFTDVILVLLIIFMVTTPMLMQSGIAIQLPKASTKQTAPTVVTLTISPAGEVYVDRIKYRLPDDLNAFKSKLASLKVEDSTIQINGDRNVKYDAVIQVLDTVSQSGINRIALGIELQRQ